MVAVAFLMLWGGYSTALWGWCLVQDYDVTFGQLLSPFHPYSGAWPPATIPASQIWPGKATPSSGGGGTGEAPGTSTTQIAEQAGIPSATSVSGIPGGIDAIKKLLP